MLKQLPVANLNQIKDTKVLKVISKWAKKPSVSGVPEEETSSSDVDSRGLSPQDAQDDASRRESHISSSSDEMQNSSKSIDIEKPKDNDVSKSNVGSKVTNETEKIAELVDDNVFEPTNMCPNAERKPEPPKAEGEKSMEADSEGSNSEVPKAEVKKLEGQKSEGLKSGELKSQSLKPEELKAARMKVARMERRSPFRRIVERVGDSSEEESRWSEDDTGSSDSESIVDLAADLLDQWSSLKVTYW